MSEPAFLTVVSITLLILALIDYLVPILTSTFLSSNDWNGKKERKLEDICQSLSGFILQMQDFWALMLKARNNRPTIVRNHLFVGLFCPLFIKTYQFFNLFFSTMDYSHLDLVSLLGLEILSTIFCCFTWYVSWLNSFKHFLFLIVKSITLLFFF